MKIVSNGENLVKARVVASLQTGLEIPRTTMGGPGIQLRPETISHGGTMYAPLQDSQSQPMIESTRKCPTGEDTVNK